MSEPEYHIGKLIPIKTRNVEKTAKEILEKECPNYKRYSEDDTYVMILEDNLYKKYAHINGVIYKIEDTELENLYVTHMTSQKDGSINYIIGFHNGGCGFYEALEDGLNELKEKSNVY